MRRITVFCSVLVLLVPLFLLALPPGAIAQNAKFVGSDACKNCHEDAFKSYVSSIHGKAYVPGSPGKREGCEACHGPGSVHVEKGGGKEGIISSAKHMAANCQSCHQDSKALAFWNMGRHKTNGVYCADCHSSHAVGIKKNLKAPEPVLCYGCHKDIRSQTGRQSHHPVNEGKMKCSDCHSSHGSFGKAMIKADSTNELCYKCHAEKRGPYMFEHPPVSENCLNCHQVHGSSHNQLLIKKPPQLCQACHDWSRHPGTPYTKFETFKGPSPSNRMYARNCSLCHTTVHGSNGPAGSGLRFVR